MSGRQTSNFATITASLRVLRRRAKRIIPSACAIVAQEYAPTPQPKTGIVSSPAPTKAMSMASAGTITILPSKHLAHWRSKRSVRCPNKVSFGRLPLATKLADRNASMGVASTCPMSMARLATKRRLPTPAKAIGTSSASPIRIRRASSVAKIASTATPTTAKNSIAPITTKKNPNA